MRNYTFDTFLSTDEVTEVIEKDIENFIEANPKLLGDSLKLIGRQHAICEGRIDMIFKDEKEKKVIVIVELKLNKIGRDAINQLRKYMSCVKKETKNEVRGILVCKGIMPTFEKDLKDLKNIKILRYGWKLKVGPIK